MEMRAPKYTNVAANFKFYFLRKDKIFALDDLNVYVLIEISRDR